MSDLIPRTSLEYWAVLAAVIDHGGFAQAAVALSRSQSAVSYAIARLQETLGTELLQMQGRKAVLTPIGRTLLIRSRSIVRDMATLESVAASLRRGWEAELKLVVDAAFPRARLLNIIAELQQNCPSTQIQLSDVVLSGAEDAIVGNAADLVVTSRIPAGYLGDWIMDVHFVAAARPDHALFSLGREVTTDDLARHVQAVVRDSGVNRPRDEGWLGAEHRFTVSSMEASLATLIAGLAFAWLPEHLLTESFANGQLRRLPLQAGASRVVSLSVVLPVGASLGPAGKMAVDAFRKNAALPQ